MDAFLSSATDADTDPIKYHAARLDSPGAKVTPRGAFARMGLDFLTAPGMFPLIYLWFLLTSPQLLLLMSSVFFLTVVYKLLSVVIISLSKPCVV